MFFKLIKVLSLVSVLYIKPTDTYDSKHRSNFIPLLDELKHIKVMEKKYYYLLKSTTVTLAVVMQGKSDHYMFMTSNRSIRFNILPADVQSCVL